MAASHAILTQILAQLDALQVSQQTLQAKVRSSLCKSHPSYYNDFYNSLLQFDAVTIVNPSSAVSPTPSQGSTNILSPPIQPSTSADDVASSPEAPPRIIKASLASSSPLVGRRAAVASDKERESLLYPGRVNLTSKSIDIILTLIVIFSVRIP